MGICVLELVKAGGWPMIPLLMLSAVGLAIIVERLWALRRKAVMPAGLGAEVRAWAARGRLDPAHIDSLRSTSQLGALLAAALDVLMEMSEHRQILFFTCQRREAAYLAQQYPGRFSAVTLRR